MTTTPDSKLASDFSPAKIEQWRGMVDKALKGADFDKRLVAKTADGIRVEPLYTRKDALVSAEGAMPGAAPFTRGTKSLRNGLGWDIRTIHIESDPEALNAAILDDLDGGVTSIALQAGGIGLAPTKEAFAAALKDVLLDVCPIAVVAEEQFFAAATALMAVWTERGFSGAQRHGAFGADPLGVLARQGVLAETVETNLARAVALTKMALPMPNVTALIADGTAYHVAGATEAQELACMLATFVSYLRACEQGGIAPKDGIAKISVLRMRAVLVMPQRKYSSLARRRIACWPNATAGPTFCAPRSPAQGLQLAGLTQSSCCPSPLRSGSLTRSRAASQGISRSSAKRKATLAASLIRQAARGTSSN